jgi:hypothetical protein
MAPHPRCQRERAQKICESPVRPPSALVIHRSAPKVPPMAIFPHPERPKFVRLEHSNSHRWRIMVTMAIPVRSNEIPSIGAALVVSFIHAAFQ